MAYKDPAKRKEKAKEYYEKNKEKMKEKQREYDAKNKEKRKEKQKEYYEKNGEKLKESSTIRREDHKQHAYDSITSCEIIDQHKWNVWCNDIKSRANNNKNSYSDDFTSDIMFEMMTKGCFYCGDIATTIDRVDSTREHALENCVGCCYGCNMSKGAADSATFVKKAYYRVCGEYIEDDTEIWFVHKKKPSMWNYTRNAENKGVSFELTKEYFDDLIKGICAYCNRRSTTWFGVDRVVPSKGYVIGNVVSCCYDCNLDKLDSDVDTTYVRNKRIADRVITGELVIPRCEKVILHRNQKPV